MVAARDVLTSLSNMGITIEAHGDSLRCRPKSALLTKPVSHADREWARFLSVAVPTRNGWRNPAESTEIPSGITGEQWNAFIADCRNLGKRSKT